MVCGSRNGLRYGTVFIPNIYGRQTELAWKDAYISLAGWLLRLYVDVRILLTLLSNMSLKSNTYRNLARAIHASLITSDAPCMDLTVLRPCSILAMAA